MKKPTRTDFGWTRQHGWGSREDIDRWSDALCAWENRGRIQPGRARSYPVHPSWNEYLPYFISTNPTRSQGAFCRWAGLSTAYVSAAKNKRITKAIEEKLSTWIEELKKLETDEQQ